MEVPVREYTEIGGAGGEGVGGVRRVGGGGWGAVGCGRGRKKRCHRAC